MNRPQAIFGPVEDPATVANFMICLPPTPLRRLLATMAYYEGCEKLKLVNFLLQRESLSVLDNMGIPFHLRARQETVSIHARLNGLSGSD